MKTYGWREIDFRPAPPGWRNIYLSGEYAEGYFVTSMPGWLICEECAINVADESRRFEGIPWHDRERNVEVAEMSDGDVVRAAGAENYWMTVGPGEPLPASDMAWKELSRRDGTPSSQPATKKEKPRDIN